MKSKIKRYEVMLPPQTKNHCSYPISCNEISSFCDSYNDDRDHYHQHYFSVSSSPSSTNLNYLQNQESNLDTTIEIETKETPPQPSPFIKRILVVDDDPDITLTFKAGLEGYCYSDKKRFEVYTYNDPLLALTQFKSQFYDLLLTDIYMPNMDGFQLCEKISELDVNVKVCFISAFEINIQALREVYPKMCFGCFIKKPVTMEDLIKRLSAELD